MDVPITPVSNNSRKVGDYIGSVNQNGRVTLPDEVRRALRLHPQDKVIFRVTEDTVMISGKLPTLEELAGSLQTRGEPKDVDEVIREAKEEKVDRSLHHMQT